MQSILNIIYLHYFFSGWGASQVSAIVTGYSDFLVVLLHFDAFKTASGTPGQGAA